MDEIIEISQLLSFREIMILLQGIGYKTTIGIAMTEEILSEEELVTTLYEMAEKGILETKGEEFLVDRQIGEMMLCMGEPERFFEFVPGEEELPGYFCYERNGYILITQLFPRKKDTLKLTLLELSEYERWKERMIDDIGGYQSTDNGEDL